MQNTARINIRMQWLITLAGLLLFGIKLWAWYLTGSVAVLTDALESTVNIVSAFLGLYSLYLSAKPRDTDHPYGHGKVEFVTSAIEGTLVFAAGVLIISEAIQNLRTPHIPKDLDTGIWLILSTAIVNYVLGMFSIRTGRKNNSLPLISSGKHLQSDTWSTLGITIGLLVMHFTSVYWLDPLIAILFAGIILYTGYKIIRESLAGIMDEADEALLQNVVEMLQEKRHPNWIDLHNLRIIKYGGTLHLDCHLTVPWYFNVNEAHQEVDLLEQTVAQHFSNSVELFVHVDGCMEFSCRLCHKSDCPVRRHAFEREVHWTIRNISTNRKHQLGVTE
ncbi:MAG: cation transporter [Bacteroidia bacterium]|nr:cation transporter [Bacteroidia bacterium]